MEPQLTALLAPVAPRLYWGRAPQNTPARPYVVLSRISGLRGYHTQGPDGLIESRVQIDVYADTYITAHNTGGSIISALSGYSGGTIQAIFIDSERDFGLISNAGAQSDPSELFRRSIDVIVHHAGD